MKHETYLMNPITGSVDTKENWMAERADWDATEKTAEEQLESLIEVVKVGAHWFEYDAVVNLMDKDICEETHNDIAPCGNQEFVEEYCIRHLEKFGEVFVVN